jgi:hypothetical protein
MILEIFIFFLMVFRFLRKIGIVKCIITLLYQTSKSIAIIYMKVENIENGKTIIEWEVVVSVKAKEEKNKKREWKILFIQRI